MKLIEKSTKRNGFEGLVVVQAKSWAPEIKKKSGPT